MPNYRLASDYKGTELDQAINNLEAHGPRNTNGAWVRLTKGDHVGELAFHYNPVPKGAIDPDGAVQVTESEALAALRGLWESRAQGAAIGREPGRFPTSASVDSSSAGVANNTTRLHVSGNIWQGTVASVTEAPSTEVQTPERMFARSVIDTWPFHTKRQAIPDAINANGRWESEIPDAWGIFQDLGIEIKAIRDSASGNILHFEINGAKVEYGDNQKINEIFKEIVQKSNSEKVQGIDSFVRIINRGENEDGSISQEIAVSGKFAIILSQMFPHFSWNPAQPLNAQRIMSATRAENPDAIRAKNVLIGDRIAANEAAANELAQMQEALESGEEVAVAQSVLTAQQIADIERWQDVKTYNGYFPLDTDEIKNSLSRITGWIPIGILQGTVPSHRITLSNIEQAFPSIQGLPDHGGSVFLINAVPKNIRMLTIQSLGFIKGIILPTVEAFYRKEDTEILAQKMEISIDEAKIFKNTITNICNGINKTIEEISKSKDKETRLDLVKTLRNQSRELKSYLNEWGQSSKYIDMGVFDTNGVSDSQRQALDLMIATNLANRKVFDAAQQIGSTIRRLAKFPEDTRVKAKIKENIELSGQQTIQLMVLPEVGSVIRVSGQNDQAENGLYKVSDGEWEKIYDSPEASVPESKSQIPLRGRNLINLHIFLREGDRVSVEGQQNPLKNGIYLVRTGNWDSIETRNSFVANIPDIFANPEDKPHTQQSFLAEAKNKAEISGIIAPPVAPSSQKLDKVSEWIENISDENYSPYASPEKTVVERGDIIEKAKESTLFGFISELLFGNNKKYQTKGFVRTFLGKYGSQGKDYSGTIISASPGLSKIISQRLKDFVQKSLGVINPQFFSESQRKLSVKLYALSAVSRRHFIQSLLSPEINYSRLTDTVFAQYESSENTDFSQEQIEKIKKYFLAALEHYQIVDKKDFLKQVVSSYYKDNIMQKITSPGENQRVVLSKEVEQRLLNNGATRVLLNNLTEQSQSYHIDAINMMLASSYFDEYIKTIGDKNKIFLENITNEIFAQKQSKELGALFSDENILKAIRLPALMKTDSFKQSCIKLGKFLSGNLAKDAKFTYDDAITLHILHSVLFNPQSQTNISESLMPFLENFSRVKNKVFELASASPEIRRLFPNVQQIKISDLMKLNVVGTNSYFTAQEINTYLQSNEEGRRDFIEANLAKIVDISKLLGFSNEITIKKQGQPSAKTTLSGALQSLLNIAPKSVLQAIDKKSGFFRNKNTLCALLATGSLSDGNENHSFWTNNEWGEFKSSPTVDKFNGEHYSEGSLYRGISLPEGTDISLAASLENIFKTSSLISSANDVIHNNGAAITLEKAVELLVSLKDTSGQGAHTYWQMVNLGKNSQTARIQNPYSFSGTIKVPSKNIMRQILTKYAMSIIKFCENNNIHVLSEVQNGINGQGLGSSFLTQFAKRWLGSAIPKLFILGEKDLINRSNSISLISGNRTIGIDNGYITQDVLESVEKFKDFFQKFIRGEYQGSEIKSVNFAFKNKTQDFIKSIDYILKSYFENTINESNAQISNEHILRLALARQVIENTCGSYVNEQGTYNFAALLNQQDKSSVFQSNDSAKSVMNILLKIGNSEQNINAMTSGQTVLALLQSIDFNEIAKSINESESMQLYFKEITDIFNEAQKTGKNLVVLGDKTPIDIFELNKSQSSNIQKIPWAQKILGIDSHTLLRRMWYRTILHEIFTETPNVDMSSSVDFVSSHNYLSFNNQNNSKKAFSYLGRIWRSPSHALVGAILAHPLNSFVSPSPSRLLDFIASFENPVETLSNIGTIEQMFYQKNGKWFVNDEKGSFLQKFFEGVSELLQTNGPKHTWKTFVFDVSPQTAALNPKLFAAYQISSALVQATGRESRQEIFENPNIPTPSSLKLSLQQSIDGRMKGILWSLITSDDTKDSLLKTGNSNISGENGQFLAQIRQELQSYPVVSELSKLIIVPRRKYFEIAPNFSLTNDNLFFGTGWNEAFGLDNSLFGSTIISQHEPVIDWDTETLRNVPLVQDMISGFLPSTITQTQDGYAAIPRVFFSGLNIGTLNNGVFFWSDEKNKESTAYLLKSLAQTLFVGRLPSISTGTMNSLFDENIIDENKSQEDNYEKIRTSYFDKIFKIGYENKVVSYIRNFLLHSSYKNQIANDEERAYFNTKIKYLGISDLIANTETAILEKEYLRHGHKLLQGNLKLLRQSDNGQIFFDKDKTTGINDVLAEMLDGVFVGEILQSLGSKRPWLSASKEDALDMAPPESQGRPDLTTQTPLTPGGRISFYAALMSRINPFRTNSIKVPKDKKEQAKNGIVQLEERSGNGESIIVRFPTKNKYDVLAQFAAKSRNGTDAPPTESQTKLPVEKVFRLSLSNGMTAVVKVASSSSYKNLSNNTAQNVHYMQIDKVFSISIEAPIKITNQNFPVKVAQKTYIIPHRIQQISGYEKALADLENTSEQDAIFLTKKAIAEYLSSAMHEKLQSMVEASKNKGSIVAKTFPPAYPPEQLGPTASSSNQQTFLLHGIAEILISKNLRESFENSEMPKKIGYAQGWKVLRINMQSLWESKAFGIVLPPSVLPTLGIFTTRRFDSNGKPVVNAGRNETVIGAEFSYDPSEQGFLSVPRPVIVAENKEVSLPRVGDSSLVSLSQGYQNRTSIPLHISSNVFSWSVVSNMFDTARNYMYSVINNTNQITSSANINVNQYIKTMIDVVSAYYKEAPSLGASGKDWSSVKAKLEDNFRLFFNGNPSEKLEAKESIEKILFGIDSLVKPLKNFTDIFVKVKNGSANQDEIKEFLKIIGEKEDAYHLDTKDIAEKIEQYLNVEIQNSYGPSIVSWSAVIGQVPRKNGTLFWPASNNNNLQFIFEQIADSNVDFDTFIKNIQQKFSIQIPIGPRMDQIREKFNQTKQWQLGAEKIMQAFLINPEVYSYVNNASEKILNSNPKQAGQMATGLPDATTRSQLLWGSSSSSSRPFIYSVPSIAQDSYRSIVYLANIARQSAQIIFAPTTFTTWLGFPRKMSSREIQPNAPFFIYGHDRTNIFGVKDSLGQSVSATSFMGDIISYVTNPDKNGVNAQHIFSALKKYNESKEKFAKLEPATSLVSASDKDQLEIGPRNESDFVLLINPNAVDVEGNAHHFVQSLFADLIFGARPAEGGPSQKFPGTVALRSSDSTFSELLNKMGGEFVPVLISLVIGNRDAVQEILSSDLSVQKSIAYAILRSMCLGIRKDFAEINISDSGIALFQKYMNSNRINELPIVSIAGIGNVGPFDIPTAPGHNESWFNPGGMIFQSLQQKFLNYSEFQRNLIQSREDSLFIETDIQKRRKSIATAPFIREFIIATTFLNFEKFFPDIQRNKNQNGEYTFSIRPENYGSIGSTHLIFKPEDEKIAMGLTSIYNKVMNDPNYSPLKFDELDENETAAAVFLLNKFSTKRPTTYDNGEIVRVENNSDFINIRGGQQKGGNLAPHLELVQYMTGEIAQQYFMQTQPMTKIVQTRIKTNVEKLFETNIIKNECSALGIPTINQDVFVKACEKIYLARQLGRSQYITSINDDADVADCINLIQSNNVFKAEFDKIFTDSMTTSGNRGQRNHARQRRELVMSAIGDQLGETRIPFDQPAIDALNAVVNLNNRSTWIPSAASLRTGTPSRTVAATTNLLAAPVSSPTVTPASVPTAPVAPVASVAVSQGLESKIRAATSQTLSSVDQIPQTTHIVVSPDKKITDKSIKSTITKFGPRSNFNVSEPTFDQTRAPQAATARGSGRIVSETDIQSKIYFPFKINSQIPTEIYPKTIIQYLAMASLREDTPSFVWKLLFSDVKKAKSGTESTSGYAYTPNISQGHLYTMLFGQNQSFVSLRRTQGAIADENYPGDIEYGPQGAFFNPNSSLIDQQWEFTPEEHLEFRRMFTSGTTLNLTNYIKPDWQDIKDAYLLNVLAKIMTTGPNRKAIIKGLSARNISGDDQKLVRDVITKRTDIIFQWDPTKSFEQRNPASRLLLREFGIEENGQGQNKVGKLLKYILIRTNDLYMQQLTTSPQDAAEIALNDFVKECEETINNFSKSISSIFVFNISKNILRKSLPKKEKLENSNFAKLIIPFVLNKSLQRT